MILHPELLLSLDAGFITHTLTHKIFMIIKVQRSKEEMKLTIAKKCCQTITKIYRKKFLKVNGKYTV